MAFWNKFDENENILETTQENSIAGKLVLMKLHDFSEIEQAANVIRHHEYALLNLEQMESGEQQRSVDYLTGASAVMDYSLMQVASCAYILVPFGTLSGDINADYDL